MVANLFFLALLLRCDVVISPHGSNVLNCGNGKEVSCDNLASAYLNNPLATDFQYTIGEYENEPTIVVSATNRTFHIHGEVDKSPVKITPHINETFYLRVTAITTVHFETATLYVVNGPQLERRYYVFYVDDDSTLLVNDIGVFQLTGEDPLGTSVFYIYQSSFVLSNSEFSNLYFSSNHSVVIGIESKTIHLYLNEFNNVSTRFRNDGYAHPSLYNIASSDPNASVIFENTSVFNSETEGGLGRVTLTGGLDRAVPRVHWHHNIFSNIGTSETKVPAFTVTDTPHEVHIWNCTFNNIRGHNTALYILLNISFVNIHDLTIAGTEGGVVNEGGAFTVVDVSSISIQNTTVNGVHAMNGSGGVFRFTNASNIMIYNVSFYNTIVTNGSGGALYILYGNGNITINNSVFAVANASFSGGAIALNNTITGDVVIANTRIEHSQSIGGYGGGIAFFGQLVPTLLQNILFRGNQAGQDRSAQYQYGGDLYVENTAYVDHNASTSVVNVRSSSEQYHIHIANVNGNYNQSFTPFQPLTVVHVAEIGVDLFTCGGNTTEQTPCGTVTHAYTIISRTGGNVTNNTPTISISRGEYVVQKTLIVADNNLTVVGQSGIIVLSHKQPVMDGRLFEVSGPGRLTLANLSLSHLSGLGGNSLILLNATAGSVAITNCIFSTVFVVPFTLTSTLSFVPPPLVVYAADQAIEEPPTPLSAPSVRNPVIVGVSGVLTVTNSNFTLAVASNPVIENVGLEALTISGCVFRDFYTTLGAGFPSVIGVRGTLSGGHFERIIIEGSTFLPHLNATETANVISIDVADGAILIADLNLQYTINGNTFANSTSGSGWNGIVNVHLGWRSAISISGNTFANTSSKGYGGALYLSGPVNATLNNNNFSQTSSARSGGAIYVNEVVNLALSNTNFTGTTAALAGGAVALYGLTTATIDTASFRETSVGDEGIAGGALYVWNIGRLVLNNTNFEECSIHAYGGYGGSFAIEDSLGQNNMGAFQIVNCHFINSINSLGDGGAISVSNSRFISITQTYFYHNLAVGLGNDIFDDSYANLQNYNASNYYSLLQGTCSFETPEPNVVARTNTNRGDVNLAPCNISLLYDIYIAQNGTNNTTCGRLQTPCLTFTWGFTRANQTTTTYLVTFLIGNLVEMAANVTFVNGRYAIQQYNLTDNIIKDVLSITDRDSEVVVTVNAASLIIHNIIVESNASQGGMALISVEGNNASLRISKAVFRYSDTSQRTTRVLIRLYNGTASIESSTFTNFTRLVGVSLISMGENVVLLNISDTAFSNIYPASNENPSEIGGVINSTVGHNYTLLVSTSTFTNISSLGNGGALYVEEESSEHTHVRIYNSTFTTCTSIFGNGGAICIYVLGAQSSFNFHSLLFSGNLAGEAYNRHGSNIFVYGFNFPSIITPARFSGSFSTARGEETLPDELWGYDEERDVSESLVPYLVRQQFTEGYVAAEGTDNFYCGGNITTPCLTFAQVVEHTKDDAVIMISNINYTNTRSANISARTLTHTPGGIGVEIVILDDEDSFVNNLGYFIVTAGQTHLTRLRFTLPSKLKQRTFIYTTAILTLNQVIISDLSPISYVLIGVYNGTTTLQQSTQLFDINSSSSLILADSNVASLSLIESAFRNITAKHLIEFTALSLSAEPDNTASLRILTGTFTDIRGDELNGSKNAPIYINSSQNTLYLLTLNNTIFTQIVLTLQFEPISLTGIALHAVFHSNGTQAQIERTNFTHVYANGARVDGPPDPPVLPTPPPYEELRCSWLLSAIVIEKGSTVFINTVFTNSTSFVLNSTAGLPSGGIGVVGANVSVVDVVFRDAEPEVGSYGLSPTAYPNASRNIRCVGGGVLSVDGNFNSFPAEYHVAQNTSLWIDNDGCAFQGSFASVAYPLYIPVLTSAKLIHADDGTNAYAIIFYGRNLFVCNSTFQLYSTENTEELIASPTIDGTLPQNIQAALSSIVNQTQYVALVNTSAPYLALNDADWRVRIFFGWDEGSSTPFSTRSWLVQGIGGTSEEEEIAEEEEEVAEEEEEDNTTPVTPRDNNSSSKGKKLSGGAVAGIVIGAVVVVGLVVAAGVIFFLWKRKKGDEGEEYEPIEGNDANVNSNKDDKEASENA